ncbi:MAG TPA: carboxypeptidase regulatory-like domain-containing protein, partial [Burkholderiales bacterium]|nr:carboxypeptidase regulatory-like domain-containing protein [Burkholderiales bacterium]
MKPQGSARLRLSIPVWVCAFGLWYAATAHGQALSPEVSRGLSWLQSRVQSSGTLANEGSSIATVLQNRAEVAQTLKTLSALPASLADAIAGESEGNTEYLARRIVSLALAGRDVSALVTALSAHQNLDGGFGGGAGYDSNPLETAWALIAFKSANAIAPVLPALGYLTSAQASDGSYSAPGRPDVESTAIAVLAQRLYASEFNNAITTIQRAVAYLLAQQSPGQQWGDSVFLTSTAYQAVHDFVSLEPVATAVRAFLVARQGSEGSWDSGDPFSTALALRALLLAATTPANPTLAIIRGKVIDGQTGFPLDGVSAALTGPATPAPATSSAGVFEFRDLPPGTYGLQLSLSQYGTITTTTNVSAGQTLNLGVLQMSKSAGATTGTVRGTVKDSTTNQPIGNALVATNGGLSTLTDGTGNYQIANVPPGTITVQASKSGYANAGGTGSLSAGGVFVFSASLVPGSQTGAGANLLGTVNRAPDGAPLAGVSITVSGATSTSAITDAQGGYRITGLNPGVTQVSATLSGFDSVSAATKVVANATVNFSPVLFPTNTSPPNGNKASVTGVVMDSGTNAALPGVSVSATFGTTTAQALTAEGGRFKFEGITTATVDLSFSLSGYQGSTVSIPLELLEALDVGQVRLRRSQVTQLLPDLAVKSLTRAGATMDPQTLAVSGHVTAVVTNIGAASAPAGVQVIAFHDANRNGAYDPGQDTLLGQASLEFELAPGAETSLLVPASGQLPFRDAPIHIWLDSTQSVIEQNETNNIASTAAAAQVQPNIGTFQPVLKWAWTGSGSVLPEHNQVMSIPVVAPIEDTNGDGKIDEHDIPGVIFHAFVGGNIVADGVLRALSGRDGHELWTVTDPRFRTNSGGHLAVADLDGDGLVEIIAPKSGGGVIVFGHDGSFKWQSPVPTTNIHGVAVADLDGDGVPEIIVGNTVLNANGTLRWQGTGFSSSLPVVADLDMDGIPEVISGAAAYRNDGQLWWQNASIGQGSGAYVAIGNLDSDPFPEIVIVNSGKVWVLEHDGTIKWGPVAIPGGGFGGPPTIADMDGDGVPEIGVAGASRYVVFHADGSILWTSPTSDFSSSSTGSSVFDFDGDGTAEVVYADEQFLRVYNGKTGAVVFSTPNSNGTLTELPVIVDVDGDNHADIIVSANQFGIVPFGQAGVRVFQDKNNSWVNTRRIWNQHSYHITNINDNGTVPRVEQNSWQVHNTYRLNARPGISATAVADPTASYLRVQDHGGVQPSTFTVRVGNGGGLGVDPGVRVAFYKGQPGAGGVLLGVGQTTQSLDQGVYEDVSISFAQSL